MKTFADSDGGVGSGFSGGTLNLKDYADANWYSIQVSGSVPYVTTYVNPTPLSFGTSSYYDQNYGYQLVAGSDSNAYQLYLSASVLVVSQSIYGPAFIKNDRNAIIDLAKPGFLFQNITDGLYYGASLQWSASIMTLTVNQTPIQTYE